MPVPPIIANLVTEASVLNLVSQFAGQIRGYAKEAGTACEMPACNALTLGVRCQTCSRRLCMSHSFWKITVPRLFPHCCYCLVEMNADLFSDDGPDKE